MKSPNRSRLSVYCLTVLCTLIPLVQHASGQTCVPPPVGLVSWYPADSYAADIQGANDGIMGGTTFGPGKVGQAFSVSQAGILVVPDSPDLSVSGSLTIDAWVNLRAYPTAAAFFAPLVTKWNDVTGNNRGYALSALSDGRLRFDISTNGVFGGSNSSTAVSTVVVPLNTWTHVAAVFDSAGRTQVLYINGIERGRVTGIPFATIFNANADLLLGYGAIGADSYKVANALIDETQIFNRALTPTEVQSIYNAETAGQCRPVARTPRELVNYLTGDGNFYDYRRQTDYLGTANIPPFAAGKVDLAFNFNGTGPSYPIDRTGISYKPSEVTIEAWVKTSATTSDFQAIVSATDQTFVHLQLYSSGNSGVFTDTGLVLLPIIPQTPTGVWRHIALSVKSGETKLYLNGALFGSNTATFNNILYPNDLRIGGGFANGRLFKGQIDEVSIYTRALSQTEIQGIYNAGSVGKLEPSNDDFNRGKFLSSVPGNLLFDFGRASKEQGEPNHAGIIGGSSVWYRWIAPTTGRAYFNTSGSNYDTLLAVYTGTSLNALTPVVSNDDRPGPPIRPPSELPPIFDTTSSVDFNVVAGQEYRIAVDGVHGQAGKLKLKWGAALSINGSVRHKSSGCLSSSGCAVPGVPVTLSGTRTGSAVTNSLGEYSFAGLPLGGNYTVTASGYSSAVLTAISRDTTVNFCDNCTTIFTDTTITVAGVVSGSGGLAYPGVTMFLNDLSGPTAVTGVDGSFVFANLPVGRTYTILPLSRTADNPLTFSPPSITINTAVNDVLGADFKVTGGQFQYFVSGFVKDTGGQPVAGVTMTLSGTQTAVTQTDANGAYSFNLAPSGSYSITPSKAGLAFTERVLNYPNLSQSFKAADFIAAAAPALTISGRLRNVNQRGLSGETVILSGDSSASTTTDANGGYSFTVNSGGDYEVAPSDSRVQGWTPANSHPFPNLTQSSNADFQAQTPTFTVTGVVKNSGGTTFTGAKVRLTGTNLTTKDYTTNSGGSYTSDPLNILGDYTFTPQSFTASGTTYSSFNPTNKSFVSILTCPSVPGANCSNFDYLGIDFTGLPSPTVVTSAASSITTSTAILNGTVNPNGFSTNGWFEWGTDPTLTTNTATTQQSKGAGTSNQALTQSLAGLAGGTTYYFRAVASNTNGILKGSILSFSTVPTAPIQATVQTNPVGRSFAVDGATYTTSQVFSWIPGSMHSISTTSLQNGDPGTRYVWSSWSDNNPISHSVTVPNTNTIYTANFFTQHMLTMNAGTGGAVNPGSAFYNSGLTVPISATPNSGFVFVGWTGSGAGAYTGSTNNVSVTLNGPITQTANFTPTNPQWQPVVLTTDQIADMKAWTVGGRTYVYVKPQFPDAGYRVVNWGQVVRAVNDFSADASVEKYTGPSIQAAVTTAQIYDLGPLANGNYTFAFKNSATVVKSLIFTVSPVVPPPNPIDDARQFVKQQYRDFLNREADPAGEDFWTDNITKCSDPARRPPGQTIEQCTLRQRETTSGAFFQSPEFQYTGYYVYRMFQGALGRQPKLSEFIPDAQFVGNGIVVNGQLSGAKINQNKAAFAALFVNCTDPAKYRCGEFKAIYDGLNNTEYVDKLFLTTGVNASASDRTALVNALNGGTETRATVLQKVVDGINVIAEGNQQFTTTYGQAFYNNEFNRAFVQLQYFGYMKRDPDDAGYAFWLGKLNQFGGNFVNAEMVLAFISSPEYRSRFGQP